MLMKRSIGLAKEARRQGGLAVLAVFVLELICAGAVLGGLGKGVSDVSGVE